MVRLCRLWKGGFGRNSRNSRNGSAKASPRRLDGSQTRWWAVEDRTADGAIHFGYFHGLFLMVACPVAAGVKQSTEITEDGRTDGRRLDDLMARSSMSMVGPSVCHEFFGWLARRQWAPVNCQQLRSQVFAGTMIRRLETNFHLELRHSWMRQDVFPCRRDTRTARTFPRPYLNIHQHIFHNHSY